MNGAFGWITKTVNNIRSECVCPNYVWGVWLGNQNGQQYSNVCTPIMCGAFGWITKTFNSSRMCVCHCAPALVAGAGAQSHRAVREATEEVHRLNTRQLEPTRVERCLCFNSLKALSLSNISRWFQNFQPALPTSRALFPVVKRR